MSLSSKELLDQYAEWLRAAMVERWGEVPHDYRERVVQLAKEAGHTVSRETVWRILKKRSVAEATSIQAIAAGLGVRAPPKEYRTERVGDTVGGRGRVSEAHNAWLRGEMRERRRPEAAMLRALVASDYTLREKVTDRGAEDANVMAILSHEAAQMVVDGCVRALQQTLRTNEIGDTHDGRQFLIRFLSQLVRDWGPRGLNVTDLSVYLERLREADTTLKASGNGTTD